MSTVISITTRRCYGVARVCRVFGRRPGGRLPSPPSSGRVAPRRRPGPQGPMPDAALVEAIRRVLDR